MAEALPTRYIIAVKFARTPLRAIVTAMTLTAAALIVTACSDEPKRPPVSTEGSAQPNGSLAGAGGGSAPLDDDGGLTEDTEDAGQCTSLENDGSLIDQLALNEELVAGNGGELTDGIYAVTEATLYQGFLSSGLPGPTGISIQGTLRITGSYVERVLVTTTSNGASSESRVTGTLTSDGVNATLSLSCPFPAQEQLTYSVVNDNVVIFSNLVTKESLTFTKAF